MKKLTPFQVIVLRQQKEARTMFKQLAKICPGAFDSKGRPLVATLTFPALRADSGGKS